MVKYDGKWVSYSDFCEHSQDSRVRWILNDVRGGICSAKEVYLSVLSVVYANLESIRRNHSSVKNMSVYCGVCVHTGGYRDMYMERSYTNLANNR